MSVDESLSKFLRIERVELKFADGSSTICSPGYQLLDDVWERELIYNCGEARVNLYVGIIGKESYALGVEVESLTLLDPLEPVKVEFQHQSAHGLLGLTLHPGIAGMIYGPAFKYYNYVAIDKEPQGPKPPDTVDYPPRIREIGYREFIRGYPCWTYHYFGRDFKDLIQYTVFSLTDHGEEYLAIATFTNGDATGYIGPGPTLKVFVGKSVKRIDKSRVMALAVAGDPYEAVKKMVQAAATTGIIKLRKDKPRPGILGKLGWCSWNALLTSDLSHKNITAIIRGLVERGIPIKWVIVDDGWQIEDRLSLPGLEVRVMKELGVDSEKFPKGLDPLVSELKSMGIEKTGLWHTINIHWGGVQKRVVEQLGGEAYRVPLLGTYVPHYDVEKALGLYTRFYKWIRESGFNFVKVDNQWVIHALYQGEETVGRIAKNVELALQTSAQNSGIEILNCMSMAPENYSNFVLSNVMRVSIDYIPFWRVDAKLHILFSVYNSLFFAHIAYPDYDMWMSYDPYAMAHAVARVMSGGPIYITDRDPRKTNVELLKRIVLPGGEVVTVDEPGVPTRDILFRDPYTEEKLLKIAAPVKWAYAVGVINVHRDGKTIRDTISLEILPHDLGYEEYAYYLVNSGEKGILGRGDRIVIELSELEADIVILAPVRSGKAVIGLREYLLPPYPVDMVEPNRVVVRAKGTLLYYADGEFREIVVEQGKIVDI
ncbi:MAG: Sip1-related alpha-galactosidase [Thermoprotei archaeon]